MPRKADTTPPADAAPRRKRGRPPGGPEQAQATKARIRQAALELFAEHGFHGTGVADIGSRAGVQRGSLYFHIGSKEELLFEVLRGNVAEVLEAAQEIAASDLLPLDKIRELVGRHVATIVTRRVEVAVYTRDRAALTGQRFAELETMRRGVQDAWTQILEEAVTAGAVRSADHVLVNGIIGLINMTHFWYRPDGPDTPERIAEKLSGLILDGLALRPDEPVS
jgi:AcrR family transcriptional regulator